MSLDVSLELEITEIRNVFDYNITHNLNTMADKAGVYEALWRPEEINAKRGHDLIYILENGLTKLKEKPEYFKQWEAPNGWGTYEGLVKFVEKYLDACKRYPDARIRVSR